MKILIVESDQKNRDIASQFLQRLDIETTAVGTLEAATKADVRQDFDVIVMGTIFPDSSSPHVALCFAELARAAVVVLVGCPKYFKETFDEYPMMVVDKTAFAGSIHETLEIIRQKLGHVT